MGLECRRLPGTPWSTSGRGTDADPLKTRLQWAGPANTMEMKSPRNTHPYIGLSKERRQEDNAGQRQEINDKERLRRRSERKESREANKRHKLQQSQGRCDVGYPRSGIRANDRLDERSGSQHGRDPSHGINDISNRHDDAHTLDWKGRHEPQPETTDRMGDPLRSQRPQCTDSNVDAGRNNSISRREEKDRFRVREVDLTIPRDPNLLREADLTALPSETLRLRETHT